MTYVPAALRREVIKRAGNRCEYCRIPAEIAFYPHEVDHVITEKHGGTTDIDNLAFACWRCNRHKGTDLTFFDPQTRRLSPLFNPRTQVWAEHFADEEEKVIGMTPEGRTTVSLLRLNRDERRIERRSHFHQQNSSRRLYVCLPVWPCVAPPAGRPELPFTTPRRSR